MEEKFLKAREERETHRLGRAKEVSEVAAQRQLFDEQAGALERAAEAQLAASNRAGAQSALSELRALVLDASNSVSLTGHDMARANGTLARLQLAVDGSPATAVAAVAEAEAVGGGEGAPASPASPAGRKFKFSKKVKEAHPPAAGGQAAGDADPSHAATAAAGSHGATYGPAEDTAVFVPPSRAAFIQDCRGCTVLAVPIAGSVFVSNCRDCSIYVCCHQLRMKDCHNMAVYVWCASTPIIENCDGMRFGPYTRWTGLLRSSVAVPPSGELVSFPTHEEWVRTVGDIADLDRTRLSYEAVDDFQWLRKTASPNWRAMTEEEAAEETTPFPPATS